MLVDIEIDKYVSQVLDDHIKILALNSYPMFFYEDKEKDKLAVNHLIHCMKVVSDYYSDFDKPKYFDYSGATR